jgi:hypothetical protein
MHSRAAVKLLCDSNIGKLAGLRDLGWAPSLTSADVAYQGASNGPASGLHRSDSATVALQITFPSIAAIELHVRRNAIAATSRTNSH